MSRKAPKIMRCHYEVLGLPRDASSEDIKKSYKKLALQWHPDRNYGQEELATQTFKEIAAAYTVLSDPQEKKWYDDHREAILRGRHTAGGASEDGEDDEDDIGITPNLFPYFSTSCFRDFSDEEPDGFYPVYSDIFEEIVQAEIESGDGEKCPSHPVFGTSDSPDRDVLNFYSHWENFVTTLSFAWVDKYNALEASCRQEKRLMEKENNKIRDTARKEYIGEVRSLVSFVKKRDPRMARIEANKKQKKLEEEQRKVELKKLHNEKKQALRAKWAESFEEEQRIRDDERKKAFLLADNDSEDEEENIMMDVMAGKDQSEIAEALANLNIAEESEPVGDNNEADDADSGYGCEICDKLYKTEMQLNQHLASKNHRKKAQEIAKKTGANKKKSSSTSNTTAST